MEYVNLGSSGLKVSRICLGMMTYGSPKWRPWVLDRAASRPFIRRAIDAGINFFDTANLYSNGLSEVLTGKLLKEYARRDEIIIATKVYFHVSDDITADAASANASAIPPNTSGLSRKHIFSAVDASLKRLGTDYIDLYLLHWIGRYPFSETVRAFTELQQEGKIVRWGMSNLDVKDMEHILALPKGTACAANQVLYNLKERGIEFDLLPWSRRHGIPIMAYTPLGEGRLRHHKTLAEIARRHEATPTQVMLAWMTRQPGIIAIPKAGSLVHVEENARSLDLTLTEEDLHEIDQAFPAPTQKIPLAGW